MAPTLPNGTISNPTVEGATERFDPIACLDEASVSRRHAILVPEGDGTRILDDRSSNGTFVNGRRIQQADLSNGDVIVVGRVVLRYLEL